MGNMLLPGRILRHGRRIKIIKADGTVMKMQSRVSVKKILINYPNHRIFEEPAGSPLGVGSFSRPLPETAELVAGHLYYLIPFPYHQVINYDNNGRKREPFASASSDHSIPSASSRLQPSADKGTDSIKQEATDHGAIGKINIRGGGSIVSSSSSTHGSIARVKLRVRKEEVSSFLSANNLLLMKNVVVPSLIERSTQQSALSPWKPSLDTITEPDSPHGDS